MDEGVLDEGLIDIDIDVHNNIEGFVEVEVNVNA